MTIRAVLPRPSVAGRVSRSLTPAVLGVLATLLVTSGCAAPVASPPPTPTSRPTASATAVPTATPAAAPEAELGVPHVVAATANVFGAGHDRPPAPAGSGGGSMPPVWRLPAGATRIVTLPSVIGSVNPISDIARDNGPGGDMIGPTNVTSFEGISGIVDRHNGMFLVGVFLTDDPPSDPAPPRLDFTDGEQFDQLAPDIGQTFFVGDGTGRSYIVPAGATRLFLGFADGYFYQGAPGWYGNNAGELEVTVEVTSD